MGKTRNKKHNINRMGKISCYAESYSFRRDIAFAAVKILQDLKKKHFVIETPTLIFHFHSSHFCLEDFLLKLTSFFFKDSFLNFFHSCISLLKFSLSNSGSFEEQEDFHKHINDKSINCIKMF